MYDWIILKIQNDNNGCLYVLCLVIYSSHDHQFCLNQNVTHIEVICRGWMWRKWSKFIHSCKISSWMFVCLFKKKFCQSAFYRLNDDCLIEIMFSENSWAYSRCEIIFFFRFLFWNNFVMMLNVDGVFLYKKNEKVWSNTFEIVECNKGNCFTKSENRNNSFIEFKLFWMRYNFKNEKYVIKRYEMKWNSLNSISV